MEELFLDSDSDEENVTEEEVVNQHQEFQYNMLDDPDLDDPRDR
jgi:hypothetical protein